MPTQKKWWESKTILFNAVTMIVAVLSMVPTSFDLSTGDLKALLFVVAVLNVCLRAITGQAISPLIQPNK